MSGGTVLIAMVVGPGTAAARRVAGAALTAAAITEAVAGLDGGELHLEAPGEAIMSIGGGPSGFFVHATRDGGERFAVASTPGTPPVPVAVTFAGTPSALPAHALLDVPTTLAVALAWAESAALDPRVSWT
jgi:hypothetical protein